MDSLKDIIKMLPNSVSGDGKVYAATIKKVLDFIGTYINNNVDEKLDQLGDGAAACVTGLHLTEQHTTDSNGMPQNNILVEYDNTNVENFLHCQIWVKDSSTDVYAQHGTASGLKYIIEGVYAGQTYTVKAVSVNKQGGTSAFADSPTAEITIKGSSLIPETPRQFVLTWDEVGPLWEWLHNDNGYVDFFELRLDGKAGEYSENLLDRTRVMRSRANPNIRSGTAYLFVRNIFGTYSQPATLLFSKPVAAKPNKPTLEKTMYGISITMDELPSGYNGYKLIINGEEYKTVNREFLYYQFNGQVTVKYCFTDAIGDGEYSEEVTVTIKTVLELVELPTIDRTKIDESIKTALEIADAQPGINESTASAISQNSSSISAVVTELGKDPSECSYGAITALQDAVELRVMKDGIITAINLSPETITIDGKFIHITGTTIIDNNVIVGGNIASNSITSAHIRANAITASKIDADAIHVGGANSNVTIEDGALVVGGENGNVTITDGAIDGDMIQAGSIIGQHISAGAVTAEKIAAGSVTAEKIAAGAIQVGGASGNVSIQDGAIDAVKLNVTTLSTITAKIGELKTADSGARTVIKDNLIEVYDSNNVLRVRMGVW